MKILSLDFASKTGWAHSTGPSGTWDLSIRRDESSGMRLIRLRGKLEEIRQSAGIDLVVFEAVRHLGTGSYATAVLLQTEMQGVVKLWCDDNKVEYRGYGPPEIKKHATGKGNANKEKMVEAARKRFGRLVDDNEADALWLLDLVMKELGIASQRTAITPPDQAPTLSAPF